MNHTRNSVLGQGIVRGSSTLRRAGVLALVCGVSALVVGCQHNHKNDATTQPSRAVAKTEADTGKAQAKSEAQAERKKTNWTKDQTLYGFFPPEDQVRDVDRAAALQAAVGAREDATLYPRHFDGAGKLNSLGRSKLFLMTRDLPTDEPVVVYVDAPAGDDRLGSARTDGIRRYLHDGGIAASRVEVRSGPNPATAYPAAPGIARLNRTDSTGGNGAAIGGAAVGAPAGGTGYTPGGMTK